MSTEPEKPASPFRLNAARIVILVMGLVLLLIIASSLLGGLGNYQQLRDAAQDAKQSAPPAN